MAILQPEGDSMFSATLLVAASVVAQSDIKTKYDKFEDYTSYSVLLEKREDPDDSDVSYYIGLSCYHEGEERKPMPGSKEITLRIARFGPRWRYSEDHDVKMMEGRNRFDVSRTKYEKSVDDELRKRFENISIYITIAECRKRLESGKDWEIKIGLEEPLSLGQKTLNKIKAFLDYVQMK
jgi:hypothetical protein